MNIKKIISEMTLQEKIAFCTGADFWHTREMPKLGVPAMMMSDGPHGLRCQKGEADMIGVNKSLPATCFPTAVTAGATWNRELYAAEGNVFMALFADVLDHMEWKTGFRSDGLAMSVYNIIAVAMVGICTGIFNGLLASAGYVAPEIVNGVTVAAAQS